MTYKCDKCGMYFDEPYVIHYREYLGASAMAEDYVSPCCGVGFEEV